MEGERENDLLEALRDTANALSLALAFIPTEATAPLEEQLHRARTAIAKAEQSEE